MNGAPAVALRPGGPGDHAAMASILDGHRPEGEGSDWPERPDYMDHILATGRVVVAERGGEVMGFASTIERSGVTYLSDAFVRRGLLGFGVGGRLLAEVLPAGAVGDRFTYASADPRALHLYVRHGMTPLGILVYLVGDEAASRRLPEIASRPASAEDAALIGGLDADASGRHRPQDLAFLRSLPSVRTLLTGGPTGDHGYAFVRVVRGSSPAAVVGPAGSRSVQASAAGLMAAARHAATLAPTVRMAVPGTHPALPELLAAGFRVDGHDTFMASRPGVFDPRRYVPTVDLG